MNQIRAFLIEQGITVRRSVAALRTSLPAILENRSDELSLRMRRLITGLQHDWIWLDERIKMITSEIKAVSETEESCRRLMTIPGIGPLISTAMVAAIGKGEAYDRGRDFAAWLGLVPRQHSTGGRTVLGRITKRGSRYLRMLFVQAAQVIMMRPKNWPKFSFGAWLEAASTRMSHNKLGVALANKLARIAWSVLNSGKDFDWKERETVTAI
jgi:transposase